MPIRLSGSPVAVTAGQGIKEASEVLGKVSIKFATGSKYAKPSDNLFASVEASIGKAQLTYTASALSTLTRIRSILSTRNGALNTMRDGVQVLSDIALQAAGKLPDGLRTSSINVFNQVLSRVSNISATADYAGIKLLDGTFGSSTQFEAATTVTNSTAYRKAGTAFATIVNDVTQRTGTLTVAANANAGDTVTVNGVEFQFVNGAADSTMHQISVGTTAVETAKNLLAALNTSADDALKNYGFSLTAADTITVTKLTSSAATLTVADFTSSSNGARINQAFVAAPAAYSVSSSKGIFGQVGQISVLGGAADVAQLAIYDKYFTSATGQTLAAAGAAATNAGDTLTKLALSIGGVAYNAYHFHANGAGVADITDGSRIAIVEASKDNPATPLAQGDVALINLQAAHDTTGAGGALVVGALVAGFNVDAANLSFKKSSYMKVDESGGEILVNNQSIGSVKGMTAALTSASLTDLKVTDVTCLPSGTTVTISTPSGVDKQFHAALPAGNTYPAGSTITLTDATTGDTLELTLGVAKNLDLSSDRTAAAIALRNALTSGDGSTFIVGTDVTQKLTLQLGDMSWRYLTGNSTLDVSTSSAATTASLTLNNIVDKLNEEIALTAAYDKAVDSLFEQMNVSQQNLASALDQLSSIDIAQTRQELDLALRVYNACIGAMSADQKANSLLERLLDVR